MRRMLIIIAIGLVATLFGLRYKADHDSKVAAQKASLHERTSQLEALNAAVDPAYQSPHFDGRSIYARTEDGEMIHPIIESIVLSGALRSAADACRQGHTARRIWLRDAKKVRLNDEPESEYDRSLVTWWQESERRYAPVVSRYNAYMKAWRAQPDQAGRFPEWLEDKFLECSAEEAF